jgi:hypothetical protein
MVAAGFDHFQKRDNHEIHTTVIQQSSCHAMLPSSGPAAPPHTPLVPKHDHQPASPALPRRAAGAPFG